MGLADVALADLLGTFIGFVLTMCVFSYIFGDNVLFRLAIHIFIGVAAAYAAVMIWYNVIWPQLLSPLLFGGQVLLVIPLVLGIMLFAKASSRLSELGSPVMAFLVGVGAAAAVGGAVLGTVFPQANASINLFDLRGMLSEGDLVTATTKFINSGIILIGTLTTLVYFHFSVRSQPVLSSRRPLFLRIISWVGQAFIAITFGVLFVGVYAATLSALIERLDFLLEFFISLIFPVS